MQATLTQYLQEKENVLRERWRSSVELFTSRIGNLHPDSPVFGEVLRLMRELAAIIEKKGSAEQAVDDALPSIIAHLKALQSDHQLTSIEVFFILSMLRNALRDIVQGESSRMAPMEYEPLDQVSSLLNRLGLVFFENAMRLKEGKDHDQDVLAIEYALLYERTRQLAITDRLTGLYNFGYFLERLKEERLRAERYHRLLSLVLFDLDHFKKYNDSNGHPAGNEVLKKVAAILREEAREVDIVARYGGEEMVMILPETGRKRATELADRIRERIAQTPFEGMKSQPLGKVTISAGVAAFPVDAANEEDLIRVADGCLYQAKAGGRDQVAAYDPPIKVTLRYKPYHELQKVSLVGSFNNWDKEVDLMEKMPDGSFQFILALNPGLYHYKFVLNDVEWIPDPSNPERVHDSLGGDNSVLRVQA